MVGESIYIFIWKVLPRSTNKTQCLAVHYFDRASKLNIRLNIEIIHMILKNWLIDLLSRYHRISVNEMVSQESGSIHVKILCTKLNNN